MEAASLDAAPMTEMSMEESACILSFWAPMSWPLPARMAAAFSSS